MGHLIYPVGDVIYPVGISCGWRDLSCGYILYPVVGDVKSWHTLLTLSLGEKSEKNLQKNVNTRIQTRDLQNKTPLYTKHVTNF